LRPILRAIYQGDCIAFRREAVMRRQPHIAIVFAAAFLCAETAEAQFRGWGAGRPLMMRPFAGG
jgi:hypothetical protein